MVHQDPLQESLSKRQKFGDELVQDNEKEGEKEAVVPVTKTEALAAMATVRNFVQQQGLNNLYGIMERFEASFAQGVAFRGSQSSIKDYFGKGQ